MRGGEAREVAELVEARPALLRMALRLCANSDDAKDLVQDTLERAIRQGLPSGVRCPRAWLTTMMNNMFVDRCRGAARRPKHLPLDGRTGDIAMLDPDPPEPSWATVSISDVMAALDELEPSYRDVYRWHTFEHWSYERIAAQLSIQRITVGTRLTRARQKLREVLVKRLGSRVHHE